MNPLTPYLWLIKLAAAALLVAGVAFGIWLYGHHRYEAGIAAQRAAESRSLAVYTKARDAQLASAEASYHAEIDHLRLSPVRLPVVRLCVNLPSGAPSGQGARRPARASTTAAGVLDVPAGNNPLRPAANPPDISGLLAAYAAAADRLSAQLRALENAAK